MPNMHERAEKLKRYFLSQLETSLKLANTLDEKDTLDQNLAYLSNQLNHLVDQADGIEDLVFHPHHPPEKLIRTIKECVNNFAEDRSKLAKVPYSIHKEYLADTMHLGQILGSEKEKEEIFAVTSQVRALIYHLEHQQDCETRTACSNLAFHEDPNDLKFGIYKGVLMLHEIRESMITPEKIAA